MYLFLIPLLVGYAFNWASAFTGFYSQRFGESKGRMVCFITRNIFGIPVWVAGFILAFRVTARPLYFPGLVIRILGWFLVLGGTIPMIWALLFLRWRAYRPTLHDTLVWSGIYKFIRHPIYVGVLLVFIGGTLLHPTGPAIIACLLGLGYIYVQARLEEWDLVGRMPAYRKYMKQVPRFFPRLRRSA
jgi:protein-S-isoprenylcysteine O-methyltransferase Ste14